MIIIITAAVVILTAAALFKAKMSSKKELNSQPTGDEPYDSKQVTSVPEKQIEDLD